MNSAAKVAAAILSAAAIGGSTLGLAGCSGAARPTAIVAPVTAETLIPRDNPLYRAITVNGVVGGDQTNPLWGSEVSNVAFREALDTSLGLATMRGAPGEAPLRLDAVLEKIDQPQLTIDFTVTAVVLYRLFDRTDALVHEERVETPHTTKFTDSLVRGERLRLASEGAAQANIAEYLRRIAVLSKTEPQRFANIPR